MEVSVRRGSTLAVFVCVCVCVFVFCVLHVFCMKIPLPAYTPMSCEGFDKIFKLH